MNIKRIPIIIAVLSGLIIGYLIGHQTAHKNYEFHTDSLGSLIWRCDKMTGKTECAPPYGAWHTVTNTIE